MKNPHALRCDLLLTMSRIAKLATRVPETVSAAEDLEAVAARLDRAKRPANTCILMETSRILGRIEGALRVSSPALAEEGREDLNAAFYFVNDILLYGTYVVDAPEEDSEQALHQHENHVVPAAEFEV
jgi:hypothetical protein